MKIVFFATLSVFALSGCQYHQPRTVLDGKDLADRFVNAPTAGKAVFGIVFNEAGSAIAVTADGELATPCRLPVRQADDDHGKTDHANDNTRKSAASNLPICHGTENTAIYRITPVSVVEYRGSHCYVVTTIVDDYPVDEVVCPKHRR